MISSLLDYALTKASLLVMRNITNDSLLFSQLPINLAKVLTDYYTLQNYRAASKLTFTEFTEKLTLLRGFLLHIAINKQLNSTSIKIPRWKNTLYQHVARVRWNMWHALCSKLSSWKLPGVCQHVAYPFDFCQKTNLQTFRPPTILVPRFWKQRPSCSMAYSGTRGIQCRRYGVPVVKVSSAHAVLSSVAVCSCHLTGSQPRGILPGCTPTLRDHVR